LSAVVVLGYCWAHAARVFSGYAERVKLCAARQAAKAADVADPRPAGACASVAMAPPRPSRRGCGQRLRDRGEQAIVVDALGQDRPLVEGEPVRAPRRAGDAGAASADGERT